MTFSLRPAKAVLVATFLVSSSGWAANALIVQDGTGGIEADVMANLTSKLTARGFTVSNIVVNPNGVPAASLTGKQQVWDIRFDNPYALSAADITTYVAYMAAGGSLFVMGENSGFITRDNSIVALVTAAGGGTLTLAMPGQTETVNAPFTGPTSLSTITYLASDGAVAPPGTGSYVTHDASNGGAAIVWGPGNMSHAATGSLIVVSDVNFLQTSADANSQALATNLVSYLASPTPIVGTPGTPVPPSLLLALLGGCGILAFEIRRRRKAPVA